MIVEGTGAVVSNVVVMAGRRRYVIELSDDERVELERRVACYTFPHIVVVRAKMILYAAEGQPTTEIARRLETAPRVVAQWRKRSSRSAWLDSMIENARAARAVFPPEQVAEVKALACELPATHGLPLGRFSRTELHRLVIERGLSKASASTIWRWLHDDALKPWQQRSWIFIRYPRFREKAGRVLDLYQRRFEGRRLRPDEYVICADEKTQLQALGRRHPTLPPQPGRSARSSSNTNATAPSPTSPLGMSTTPTCSTESRPRTGSSRSAGSSNR